MLPSLLYDLQSTQITRIYPRKNHNRYWYFYQILNTLINNVLTNSLYYFWPSGWERYLPSTIWSLQKIEFKPQQIVFLSLPKVWGLRPTHMNLCAYLLNHSIILLSSTLIHDEINYSSMLRFHASYILRIWKNTSQYSTSFIYI